MWRLHNRLQNCRNILDILIISLTRTSTLHRYSPLTFEDTSWMVDIDTMNEQAQANCTRDFMTSLSSQPVVEGIVEWRF